MATLSVLLSNISIKSVLGLILFIHVNDMLVSSSNRNDSLFKISDDDIVGVNIPTGIPLVYKLDGNMNVVEKFYLADEVISNLNSLILNRIGMWSNLEACIHFVSRTN